MSNDQGPNQNQLKTLLNGLKEISSTQNEQAASLPYQIPTVGPQMLFANQANISQLPSYSHIYPNLAHSLNHGRQTVQAPVPNCFSNMNGISFTHQNTAQSAPVISNSTNSFNNSSNPTIYQLESSGPRTTYLPQKKVTSGNINQNSNPRPNQFLVPNGVKNTNYAPSKGSQEYLTTCKKQSVPKSSLPPPPPLMHSNQHTMSQMPLSSLQILQPMLTQGSQLPMQSTVPYIQQQIPKNYQLLPQAISQNGNTPTEKQCQPQSLSSPYFKQPGIAIISNTDSRLPLNSVLNTQSSQEKQLPEHLSPLHDKNFNQGNLKHISVPISSSNFEMWAPYGLLLKDRGGCLQSVPSKPTSSNQNPETSNIANSLQGILETQAPSCNSSFKQILTNETPKSALDQSMNETEIEEIKQELIEIDDDEEEDCVLTAVDLSSRIFTLQKKHHNAVIDLVDDNNDDEKEETDVKVESSDIESQGNKSKGESSMTGSEKQVCSTITAEANDATTESELLIKDELVVETMDSDDLIPNTSTASVEATGKQKELETEKTPSMNFMMSALSCLLRSMKENKKGCNEKNSNPDITNKEISNEPSDDNVCYYDIDVDGSESNLEIEESFDHQIPTQSLNPVSQTVKFKDCLVSVSRVKEDCPLNLNRSMDNQRHKNQTPADDLSNVNKHVKIALKPVNHNEEILKPKSSSLSSHKLTQNKLKDNIPARPEPSSQITETKTPANDQVTDELCKKDIVQEISKISNVKKLDSPSADVAKQDVVHKSEKESDSICSDEDESDEDSDHSSSSCSSSSSEDDKDDDIEYVCKICKRSFNKKAHLKKHMKTIHLKANGKVKKLKCKACRRKVSDETALQAHLIQRKYCFFDLSRTLWKHKKADVLACRMCVKEVANFKALKKHSYKDMTCRLRFINLIIENTKKAKHHAKLQDNHDTTSDLKTSTPECSDSIIKSSESETNQGSSTFEKFTHNPENNSSLSDSTSHMQQTSIFKKHKPLKASTLLRYAKPRDKWSCCPKCGGKWPYPSNLKRHKCLGKDSIRCNYCSRGFQSLFSLKKHCVMSRFCSKHNAMEEDSYKSNIISNDQNVVSSTTTTKHTCHACKESLDNLNTFRVHLNKNSDCLHFYVNSKSSCPIKILYCHKCGINWPNSTKFSRHLKWCTKKPILFRCSSCFLGFQSRLSLLKHKNFSPFCSSQKSDSEINNLTSECFVCLLCKVTFSHIHRLLDHSHSHTDNGDYQCNECEMSFQRYNSLVSHQIWHRKKRGHGIMDTNKQQQTSEINSTSDGNKKPSIKKQNPVTSVMHDTCKNSKICVSFKMSSKIKKENFPNDVNDTLFSCSLCKEQFSTLSRRNYHLNICRKKTIQLSSESLQKKSPETLQKNSPETLPKKSPETLQKKSDETLPKTSKQISPLCQCNLCKSIIQRKSFKRHYEMHISQVRKAVKDEKQDQKFVCSICQKSFESKFSKQVFVKHLIHVHTYRDIMDKNVYKQTKLKSEKDFAKKPSNQSEDHSQEKTPISSSFLHKQKIACIKYPLSCKLCFKKYASPPAFKFHLKMTHPDISRDNWEAYVLQRKDQQSDKTDHPNHQQGDKSDTTHECPFCYRVLNKFGFARHILMHKQKAECDKVKPITENESQVNNNTSLLLSTSMKKYSDKDLTVSKEDYVNCEICGKQLKRESLRKHKCKRSRIEVDNGGMSIKSQVSTHGLFQVQEQEECQEWPCSMCHLTVHSRKALWRHQFHHIKPCSVVLNRLEDVIIENSTNEGEVSVELNYTADLHAEDAPMVNSQTLTPGNLERFHFSGPFVNNESIETMSKTIHTQPSFLFPDPVHSSSIDIETVLQDGDLDISNSQSDYRIDIFQGDAMDRTCT